MTAARLLFPPALRAVVFCRLPARLQDRLVWRRVRGRAELDHAAAMAAMRANAIAADMAHIGDPLEEELERLRGPA